MNFWTIRSWSHVPIFAFLAPAAVLLGGCHSTGSTTATTAPSMPLQAPTIAPLRAALVLSQSLLVTATTNDNAGITWKADAGTFSSATSMSGTAVTYTAPATFGVYTITASNITNASQHASITVAVTDLPGVYTYHNDLARDGVNAQEYALTTTTVNTATFGKLFSCGADCAIYAQPLWVGNVNIAGSRHNVIVAATMRDSVYAFDADANPCVTYWQKTLIPSGETYGSRGDFGNADIFPDIGILGTPVIDRAAGTIYLVTKTKTTGGSYHQRLHALSLADGSERTNSPVELDSSITAPGTCGGGSLNPFNAKMQNQRSGLALANGVVYVAWASHGDEDPYYGWVVGYSTSTPTPVAVYNTSPNAVSGSSYCRAGIWMAGGAPAFDSSNNMYVITGNGVFDGTTDFGDSFLKLSTASGLTRLDSFTAHDHLDLDSKDLDVGSGGAVVLVDLPGGAAVQHLMLGGGKAGTLYVLNRDNLGGYQQGSGGGDNVVQQFSFNSAIFSTPAMWQNTLYIAAVGAPLQAFALNTSSSQLDTTPTSQSTATFGYPGATPSISSSGTQNGIAWAMDSSKSGTWNGGSAPAGPAVLHAYDATNLAKELWNSDMVSGDTAGNAVKFTVPTVANGKVYIGTRGNDSTQGTGTIFGEVDVYGLKPN
jgi:hypothetical protein